MMWRRTFLQKLLSAAAIALVVICDGRTQASFTNPRYAPEAQQHRLIIDRTECLSLATRMFADPPPSQSQTGTINLYTPSGPVSGTFQVQPQSQGFQPDGFLGGMQYESQRAEREAARGNYAVACMADRGWQRQ